MATTIKELRTSTPFAQCPFCGHFNDSRTMPPPDLRRQVPRRFCAHLSYVHVEKGLNVLEYDWTFARREISTPPSPGTRM